MKRILIFALILTFTLTACSPRTPVENPGTSSQPPQQESSSTPAPVKPTTPYALERLTPEQQALYLKMASGEITPEKPYLFEEDITYDDIWQPIALYAENNKTLKWRNLGYFAQYDEKGEKLIGISAAPRLDNKGKDAQMAAAFDAAMDEILPKLPQNADDYTKIKAIAEFLVGHVSYLHEADPNNNVDYSSLTPELRQYCLEAELDYGALVNGKAICSGYASAFQYLAEQLGVYSLFINGDIAATNGGHGWNMVWLEGNWYHVDVTWMDNNDGVTNYDYFLASDEEMLRTHANFRWSSAGLNEFAAFALPKASQAGKRLFNK